MLLAYLFFPLTLCVAYEDNKLAPKAIYKDKSIYMKANTHIYRNNPEVSGESRDSSYNTFLWDMYIDFLIKTTTDQLEKIRSNIKRNYKLKRHQARAIDELFNNKHEYELLLQTNLRTIIENKQFNSTEKFMLDFMDMSNWIVENLVQYNLDKVELIAPTKWYKTLRDKIQRQEVKATANYVENQLCFYLGVCKTKRFYSDYLREWIKLILNMAPSSLKQFFMAIPDSLEKHKHFVKSNFKFRKTIKTLLNSDLAIQRDTLDFVDEVLMNGVDVFHLAPDSLKKSAGLLIELFKLIDANYDLNNENIKQLDNVTKMLANRDGDVNFSDFIDAMLVNVNLNFKIWSLKEQNKIDYVWSKILLL